MEWRIKINVTKLKNFNHEKFDKFIILIILFFLLIRFLSEKEHFLEHDEVNSINLYTDIRSVFSKNYPNNHVLSSLAGFFVNLIFGVDVKYLRLISFLSFIFIILTLYLLTKNVYTIYILVFIYLSSSILLTYSALFRGYYLQALLFSIIFYLLNSHKIKLINKVKTIFLISNLLLIHIISSLYLLIPIIGVLLYLFFKIENINLQEKINIILLYLLLPFTVLHLVVIFITTIFNERITSFQKLISLFRESEQEILENIYNVFSQIYFNTWVIDSPLSIEFLNDFSKNNITLITIFILAFFKSVYKLFNGLQPIDAIILLFFVTFLLINKSPFDRVFTGIVFFFIFYLLYDFRSYNFSSNIKYASKIIILLVIIFFVFKLDFFQNFFLYGEREAYLKENFNSCSLVFDARDEMDKLIFYYLYLHECDEKPDIVEFYQFYTLQ